MVAKDMGTVWRRVACVALGIVALATSGCLAIAAGAAGGAALGYFYYRGEMCKYYSAGTEATFAATRAALLDLAMPILREENHGDTGVIESRTARSDAVYISLKKDMDNNPAQVPLTRVGVRVGTFGDDAISTTVLAQIETRLANPGPGRLIPQAPPTLGPIQPASAVAMPPQTPPPPLATQETPAPPLSPEPEPANKSPKSK
jgi:hypothetical protein